MGFWNKLGKVALQAAPYVAAPFTGGASLYAVPATQKIGQKWSEHDANENAKKGLGPSSFDKFLNTASNYTGMASSLGTPGISGGKYAPPTTFGKNAGKSSNVDKIAGVLGGIGIGPSGGEGRYPMDEQYPGKSSSYGPNFRGAGQSQGGQTGRYDGYMRGLGPVMGRRDQNVPNLAESIGAGRQDAIRNQPFRNGYDIISYGPEPADDAEGNIGPEIRTPMSPIYPNSSRRRRAS
jgi:hypothetical protein